MKKINLILSIALLVFVAAACSKEKKIENRLTKKDGTWTITSETTESYENGTLKESKTYTNAGTMKFTDDKKFTWTSVEGSETNVYTGTWSNSSDQLILIDGSFGIALPFKISDDKRKSMTLTFEQIDAEYKDLTILKLERE